MKVVPTWQAVAKEGLIVIGGAIVAALIIGQLPAVRDWINKQWGGAPKGF